jgi:3',5'-cyclic AMP phosphodiesterase CpdA
VRLIAHISDLHFGHHDPALAEGLLASLDEARPDLVAVSGDLTQRARQHEFVAARTFLARIKALDLPVLVVPGNHDVPLYNLAKRFARSFDRFNRYIMADPLPFHQDAEIAVLGINTARALAIKNGRISKEQMVAIRRTFADVPETCLKVLVTHHPLVPPPGGEGVVLDPVGRWEPAMLAADEAGVSLLLAGHYHRAFNESALAYVAAKRSMLVVQAGTAISTRTRNEQNSYNRIRLEPDRVTVTVEAWSGEGFAAAAERIYRRTGHHWHADAS